MTDRIDQICPSCGLNEVELYFISDTEESIYGLHMTAFCCHCGYHRSSFVDYGLLHFILRVASKEHTDCFADTYYRPWAWKPWTLGVFGLLKFSSLRVQVRQAWYGFCSEKERFYFQNIDTSYTVYGYPLRHEVAEHRVVGPLVRAILRSSGDLVTRVSYLQHCNGRVGQPLVS